MSILKVARMGHPILRQKARDLTPEEIRSPAIRALVRDMLETLEEYSGAGLAAPQVHQPLALALVGFDGENERYPGCGEQPLTVLFNPRVSVLDPVEQGFWEGCLSVPGLRGLVHRPRKVRVNYLDEEARPAEIVAEGFLATVFQHELDHLEGVLFVDLVRPPNLAFIEEYRKYWIEPESKTPASP